MWATRWDCSSLALLSCKSPDVNNLVSSVNSFCAQLRLYEVFQLAKIRHRSIGDQAETHVAGLP
jgi:hypothetical protein